MVLPTESGRLQVDHHLLAVELDRDLLLAAAVPWHAFM
jgi:hypothetical protein